MLLQSFAQMMKNEEKCQNTLQKYLRDLRYFTDFAKGREMDKPLICQYKSHLEQAYALSSANSMLAALNSFFRFAGWEDLRVKQFKLQRKAYCSEALELTKQEYIALIQAAQGQKKERLSLLMQTVCATGVRVSELERITVDAARLGEAVVSCKGKSRKVFLVKELCRKLLRYAKKQGIASGPIFVTKTGKAMNRSNIWREMKGLYRQAGVSPKKIFPHNLRHLFARTFYRMDHDIAKLADILGHASINTTRIYIISTGAEHRRQLENMRLIL